MVSSLAIFLVVVLFILGVFLISVILLQKHEGGVLSGLNASNVNQFLGSRGTANFLTKTTVVLAILFVIVVLALNVIMNRQNSNQLANQAEALSKHATTQQSSIIQPKSDSNTKK